MSHSDDAGWYCLQRAGAYTRVVVVPIYKHDEIGEGISTYVKGKLRAQGKDICKFDGGDCIAWSKICRI